MNDNNDSKNQDIDKVRTKTRVSTRSRVVVGLVTALVVITAIGTAIFFAGIVPPAGCQRQDNGTFKCSFTESFANNSNLNLEKTDNWMQVNNGKLVLNPAEQIKLRKGQQFIPNDKPAQQICGKMCAFGQCTDFASDVVGFVSLLKNGEDAGLLDFSDARLGIYSNLPYRLNATYEKLDGTINNLGIAMYESSNPESAIFYNNFNGSNKPYILPISPGGETEFRANICGQTKQITTFPITSGGFSDFNPVDRNLDTRFIQGVTSSKNITTNLTDSYNITSADFNPQVGFIEGIYYSGKQIKGSILVLASNNDGTTWYLPSEFSGDLGRTWNPVGQGDYIIENTVEKRFRYNFTNSEGHNLKWAVAIQSDEKNLRNAVFLNPVNPERNNAGNNFNFPPGGGADAIEIKMATSKIVDPNNANNPLVYSTDLVNGGIITAKEDEKYYFLSNDIANTFSVDGLNIESSDQNVLRVGEKTQAIFNVIRPENINDNHAEEMVAVTLKGISSGYAKIKVTYTNSNNQLLATREFGVLVLPKAYLNLDKLDVTYTAISTDEVDPDGPDGPGDPNPPLPDPNDPNPNGDISGTTTYIYRGANRVIAEISGNDDAKNKLKDALAGNNLKFNYGTDKNNLDKNAKVYFDNKANKYYAVLRDLQGGEKDGFNQDGFTDGRMKYYYRFSIGDKGIFLDSDKKTTLGTFLTLNRRRTILYYYNSIFDRHYDLNKEYDFAKVQDGGVNFWYDTNITLPGIRFMMLNDRKYKEFNNYLNKKKTTKKLVAWLYKKSLDRIYDDNLYKFADDDGVNYWYRQMTKIRSRDRISKEGVKFAISASTESRNELQELFTAKNEANAEFAYNVVLKRGGDQGGVNYLVDTFNDSQKRMREDLANSFEYNNRLETIEKDNGRKPAIAELYETLYARPADVAGVDYWSESNMTIPQIKEDFLKSDEFTNVLK